jgi:hypothetical protein
MVVAKGEKNARPPSRVLKVPNRFLVYLKIQLYHSSQSQISTLHLDTGTVPLSRYQSSRRPPLTRCSGRPSARCWGWGGMVSPFLPEKSLRMKEKEQQEIPHVYCITPIYHQYYAIGTHSTNRVSRAERGYSS